MKNKLFFKLALVLAICILNIFLQKHQLTENIQNKTPVINNANNREEEETIETSNLLTCKTEYNNSMLDESKRNDYNQPADNRLHEKRIVRGVIVFFPAEKHEHFEQEFRWVYRSWIEMQKYEPKLWRTDLIVFMNANVYAATGKKTFQELNCTVKNKRESKKDEPMCTIIDFIEIKNRVIPNYNEEALQSISADEIYSFLYKKLDVFNENDENMWKFYGKLKELNNYGYVDSILMAFDGYIYFKDNFDFLLRSDMDVFLTPLFAKWLPLNCFDFITGSGGYSHDFNMKRLKKAATLMGLKFADIRNLGSTWYSTPAQFRYVSYLTLVSMAYINGEEFSEPERQDKVGTILWPGNSFTFNYCLSFILLFFF